MNMTVAQLLKYKKRVAGDLAKVNAEIVANNSKNIKTEREVDVRKQWDLRERLIKHMIDVKMALFKVNQPIQHLIFEASEVKGTIKVLVALPTVHGVVPAAYRETEAQTFEAVIRKAEVDRRTKDLTVRLDKIQEELDAFNHTTKVEVPDFG
jgi:hypothetical protein